MAAVSLFLVGKTGHGKSSTGNSLLGREAFEVSDSAESVSSVVQSSTATVNGRVVTVIDGPGVGDTRMDTVTAVRKTCEDMEQGIVTNPNGIGAFLLVLKYGNRFTDEEKSTIDSLKSLLGENLVSDYCIIVFTHGEIFDMNNRKSGLTFPSWCSQQTGRLGDLIAECGDRCVLAYNLEPEKMTSSINELFSHVDSMVAKRGPYTLCQYAVLAPQREQLIVRTDAPRLQQVMDAEVTSQQTLLTQIQSGGGDHDHNLNRLVTLRDDVTKLKQRIVAEDKNTGVLGTQLQSCDTLLASMASHETTLQQAKANLAEQQRLAAIQAEQQRIQAEAERARRHRKRRHFLGIRF